MQDILGVKIEVTVGTASVVHAVSQHQKLSIDQNVRLCSLLSAYHLLYVLALSDTPSMELAPLRLLRMISHTRTTSKYASVESNFLFVAMHVACMKELPFPPDVFPDLPDKYDKFLNV